MHRVVNLKMRQGLFIRLQSETTLLDAVLVVSSFDQPSITSNLQALTSSEEPNTETWIEGNSLLKVVYSSDRRKVEYKAGIWMVRIENNNNYNSPGIYFLQPLICDLPNGLRQLWYMQYITYTNALWPQVKTLSCQGFLMQRRGTRRYTEKSSYQPASFALHSESNLDSPSSSWFSWLLPLALDLVHEIAPTFYWWINKPNMKPNQINWIYDSGRKCLDS